MSKTVSYKDKSYFVNNLPECVQKKPEWFLAQNNINIVFAKYFSEFTHPGAEMRSWFDGRQPSEAQVRRAMIWGYDQFGDYQIKSGGGAVSDNIFISQFKMTIADARTGYDRDVIVLKKYSNNFADVLITPAELDALQEASESKVLRNLRRLDLLSSLLREIIRFEKGVTSIAGGGNWTAENIAQMKKQCREDYTAEELKSRLVRLKDYAANFEKFKRRGGFGQDYLDFVFEQIYATNDMNIEKPANISYQPEQPMLFALA